MDWLTPWQAEEAARDQIAATPATVTGWLDAECADDCGPLDAWKLGDVLMHGARELCVPELLAVLMTCPEREAQRALYALREKFVAEMAPHIEAGARLMLAEQEAAAAQRLRHEAMEETMALAAA